ncbi:MAG: sensor histidine kinase [Aquaticitalea sp.]
MKLLNHTSKYLALLLLPLITIWAVLFYYAMLDEIYDSLDDGLENQKILLTKRATEDPRILTHNDFDKHVYAFTGISKSSYENFKERYQDTLMYMHNEDDFEPVRIYESALKQGDNYYKLKIVTSMVEEDDLVNGMIQYLIGLYILLVISILLLNNLLLKKIWKPFYHSISQLKTFNIEKKNQINTLSSTIDEFELLNDTINKLIKKSSDTFLEQKHFIENASHELQTPLAISINKLELFLETNELSEVQAKELATVLDSLARLTRLNKSLILLSKIENEQFHDVISVDFSQLTQRIVTDFEDLAAHNKITISVENRTDLNYLMNIDLASILLTNLVKNALIHGREDSSVKILIDKDKWTISNRGTTENLKQYQLFSRFKKLSTNKKSTGLGLAIAKAIADKYKLHLSYDYDDLHIFSIQFSKTH